MMRLRGPSARGERGATAVEAALVTPVVILLLLGIVEMGMLFKDYLGVSSMVRSGVRTASAHPRDAQFATLTADAVRKAGAAVDYKSIEELWVYKLDRNQPNSDKPLGMTTFEGPSGCSSSCVKFVWSQPSQTFVKVEDTWNANNQNACPSSSNLGPPDRIGVYVKLKHQALSGLIFRSLDVKDAAVMSLEPMPSTGGCA